MTNGAGHPQHGGAGKKKAAKTKRQQGQAKGQKASPGTGKSTSQGKGHG